MAERGIKVGSAGTQYGNVGGSINLRNPKQPNFARLASSLSLAIGQAKGNASEEAEREAMLALETVKAETTGMKPDERWSRMQEVRNTLGAGRGFFDKLLVDEDEVTKAWDRASARVKAIDGKRGAERLRAELEGQGKGYDEIQQALTKYHQDKMKDLKSVSETQFIEYGREVEPHILALDTDMFKKEQERVEQTKILKSTEEMNRGAHDALQSVALIAPNEIADVGSPADLKAVQDKLYTGKVINPKLVKGIVNNINRGVGTGKGLGIATSILRTRATKEYTDIANTYQSPELFEALWSYNNNGVVAKERYPEEYIKNKRALISKVAKYESDLQVQHEQKVKENNDAQYNAQLSELITARNEYIRNPSDAGTRQALQNKIFSLKDSYNQLKSSNAFVGNARQEKAWIEDIGYNESLLIQNEPLEAMNDEYERLRDNKELSKTWMAINGKFLSNEYRVEGGEIVDKRDKMATEEARSSYRRREQIVAQNVRGLVGTFSQTIGDSMSKNLLDFEPSDSVMVQKYNNLNNDFRNYSGAIAKKAEDEFIEAGGNPLDSAGVELAVKRALEKEYGNRLNEIQSYNDSELRSLKTEANSTQEVTEEVPEVEPKKITDVTSETPTNARQKVEELGWLGVSNDKSTVISTLEAMAFKNKQELLDYMDNEEFHNVVTNDKLLKMELANEVFAPSKVSSNMLL